jgi:hypothetical protein
MATVKIETPQGKDALSEFVQFYDQVYAYRTAYWRTPARLQIAILTGEGPFAEGRTVRPFLAREGSRILARVLAVVDARYNRHWHERLGHLCWFEALPDTREATRQLIDVACEWLKSQGTETARAGSGLLEFPFVIDDYESLPPNILRHNPAYYHVLLKDAGFESEKGYVDYKLEVRPELVARWESMLEAARRAGYEIVPLRDIPESRCVQEFTATFNDTFKAHWGWTPYTEAEMSSLLGGIGRIGGLDTSVLSYQEGKPVGMLLLVPEHSSVAVLKPGRMLQDSEKLNVLAIGVRETARGRGVNLAMAGYGFLELVRRGAKYLSYTLVLDDNWPSRRTGEKLGASVCANYLAYRRNFLR